MKLWAGLSYVFAAPGSRDCVLPDCNPQSPVPGVWATVREQDVELGIMIKWHLGGTFNRAADGDGGWKKGCKEYAVTAPWRSCPWLFSGRPAGLERNQPWQQNGIRKLSRQRCAGKFMTENSRLSDSVAIFLMWHSPQIIKIIYVHWKIEETKKKNYRKILIKFVHNLTTQR